MLSSKINSPILQAHSADAVLTAVKNSGSSFLLGMLALEKKRRLAMFGLYAFCRAVDDIADCDLPASERLAALHQWRAYASDLFKSEAAQPVMQLLQDAVLDYDVREQDFHDIIAGMEMDAQADIIAPSWEELDLYCDRVASAVGRISVRIFGEGTEHGRTVAAHLGRALQLTNILRDIDEDAARGRLYLPCEAIEEAGITATAITDIINHPVCDHVCRAVARVAVKHFDEAEKAMQLCDKKAIKPARLMHDYYAKLLHKLLQQGWTPLRTRVSLGPLQKLGLLLRAIF